MRLPRATRPFRSLTDRRTGSVRSLKERHIAFIEFLEARSMLTIGIESIPMPAPAPGPYVPTILTSGPDGNIWANSFLPWNPGLVRITPQGQVTAFPVGDGQHS